MQLVRQALGGGGAMALSMDEQRILAEIEQQLVRDEPALAARLSAFGRPGPANILRTPRGRMLAVFATLMVLTVVSLVVYALLPLRTPAERGPAARLSSPSGQPFTTVSGTRATGGRTSTVLHTTPARP